MRARIAMDVPTHSREERKNEKEAPPEVNANPKVKRLTVKRCLVRPVHIIPTKATANKGAPPIVAYRNKPLK
jgi:hypothetical protein